MKSIVALVLVPLNAGGDGISMMLNVNGTAPVVVTVTVPMSVAPVTASVSV